MKRLTDRDLNYVPEQPYFVQTYGPEMSGVDSELTNYDADLLDMGSAIASEPDSGGTFDGNLASMGFTPGDFQSANYDSINVDHAAFSTGFEGQLQDNESGLQNDPSPSSGATDPSQGPNPPAAGPPPAQPPGPGDFPGITCRSIKVLNPRVLNSAPDSQVNVSSDQRATTATLIFGDTSVWRVQITDQPVPGGGPFGSGPIHNVTLFAKTTKAGHFAATVQLSVAGYLVNQNFCYTIDVA